MFRFVFCQQKLIAFCGDICAVIRCASNLIKELGERNIYCCGNLLYALKRSIFLTALDLSYIRWMATGKLSYLFLAES